MATTDELIPLENEEGLDRALADAAGLLYKHSSRCFICTRALGQVERVRAERPDIPVYILDVIGHRALSARIAERFEIAHESPQAILVRNGIAVWHASHFRITAESVLREIDRLEGGGESPPPAADSG